MGEVVRAVETTVKDTAKAIVSPVEAALDVAKGDNKSAGARFVKAAGVIGDAATGGTAKVLSTSDAQTALRRAGLSDAAGFNSAITEARETGTVSNQNRDEFLRFTSQAALVGAGSYAYSNQVIPIGDGMAASGKELIAGFSAPAAPTLAEAALGYSLVKSGKNADAFEQLTGIELPDWLKDVIPSDSKNPDEFSPWKNPNASSGASYTGQQQSNPTMKILLFGGGAIALILILKKVMKK
jgi:hypothetical protein